MVSNHPIKNELVKGSFWSFTTALLAKVGGLFLTIILARYLLPDGFGLYSLAFSVAIIFVTFADMGINSATIKYISQEMMMGGKKTGLYLKYFLRLKIKVALASSLSLFILAYFLANFLFHKPEIFLPLILLSLYIFLISIDGFFESLLYIKNRVDLITFKEVIFQILRISFVLSVFLVLKKGLYLTGAVISSVLSSLFIFFILIFFCKKLFSFSEKTKIKISKTEKKQITNFIFFLTIASLSGVFFSYFDTIILGIFLPNNFVGFYRSAVTLVISLAGLLSFTGVFLNVFVKINQKNLQSFFNKILSALSIITLPLVVGTIVLSKYVLVLIYGYAYLPAKDILVILSPLIFLFSISGMISNFLSARNCTKKLAAITLSSLILNFILNLVLINLFLPYSELYATLGVAIATVFSWIFYFVFSLLVLKKELNILINPTIFIKPLLASFFMGGLILLFNLIYPKMGIIKGLIEIILGGIFYFSVLFLIKGFEKKDFFDIIPNFIKPKFLSESH